VTDLADEVSPNWLAAVIPRIDQSLSPIARDSPVAAIPPPCLRGPFTFAPHAAPRMSTSIHMRTKEIEST